ncbi:predicted protein [Postia placenta Mad-698-R]|nr:predicted protein [Postia placenta Mad-698-R]
MQTTANKVQDDKILDASADAAGGKEVRVRMQMYLQPVVVPYTATPSSKQPSMQPRKDVTHNNIREKREKLTVVVVFNDHRWKLTLATERVLWYRGTATHMDSGASWHQFAEAEIPPTGRDNHGDSPLLHEVPARSNEVEIGCGCRREMGTLVKIKLYLSVARMSSSSPARLDIHWEKKVQKDALHNKCPVIIVVGHVVQLVEHKNVKRLAFVQGPCGVVGSILQCARRVGSAELYRPPAGQTATWIFVPV